VLVIDHGMEEEERKRALTILSQDGLKLGELSSCCSEDPDLVLTAVASNPSAVRYASAELLDDYDFILEVVQRRWSALEFLPSRFREQIEIVLVAARQDRAALSFASGAASKAAANVEDLDEPKGYQGERIRLVGYFNEWRLTDSNTRFERLDGYGDASETHKLTALLETGYLSFQLLSCTRNFGFRVFPTKAAVDGFFRLVPGEERAMPVNAGGKDDGHGQNFFIEAEAGTVVTIFATLRRGFGEASCNKGAAVWYEIEAGQAGHQQIPVLSQSPTRQKPKLGKKEKVDINTYYVRLDQVKFLEDVEEMDKMSDLVFQARKLSTKYFPDRFRIRDLRDGRHLTLLVDVNQTLALGYIYYRFPVENFVWVEHIAIQKLYRKNGLGRKLIEWIQAKAIDKGYPAVRLASMVNAVGFYKKLGFKTFSSDVAEHVMAVNKANGNDIGHPMEWRVEPCLTNRADRFWPANEYGF